MKEKTKMFSSMMGLYKPYKGILLLTCLASLIMAVTELVYPLIAKYIINDLSVQEPARAKRNIVIITSLLLVLLIADAVCRYIQNVRWSNTMDKMVYNDLQTRLYKHFHEMSFSWYDNHNTGEILGLLSGDCEKIDKLLWHLPTYVLQCVITVIGACIVFSTLSWKLLLIIFPMIPIIMIFEFYYPINVMRKAFGKVREFRRKKLADMEDAISGIRTITSFDTKDREVDNLYKANVSLTDISKDKWFTCFVHHAGTNILSGMIWFLVIGVGGWWMIDGKVSLSDITLFLMNSYLITNPIIGISDIMRDLSEAVASYQKVFQVLNIEPEIKNPENPIMLDNIKGDIEFNNVTFRYDSSKDEKDVLKDFSLSIQAGEYVALAGSSGCGKSTIAGLIPRFYEINSGSITIDGNNIKDIDLGCLRKSVGIVQQDIYLFNGTVLDNIRYAVPDATMEEVIEAAKAANAHEFISKLPNGYNSEIGEKGVKLSGGQKQRIAIARLFLSNPPIVIFDEATSALDNESERQVQKSFEKLAKNRTTIVIAHRLTTIKNADRIVFLGEDGIEEMGSHAELIRKKGNYAKLYEINK